jgi:transposase
MMGRLNHDQGEFFYSFRLDEAVPDDHPVRAIAAVLDLSWVHAELAPFYPKIGRPSIDPVLMIRMLIVGYAFAIRSERALCREMRVNLAYRWFCGLSIEDKIPDHSAFSRIRHERFRESDMFRRVFERVVEACIAAGLVGGEGFAVDASLIVADANKQRSIPGTEWKKTCLAETASRATREYLATLDDAAFGAASDVTPKFVSPSDPAAQWTGAMRGLAFFAYADNYLIDVKFGIIVDVEASRAIRQAEVGAAKTMIERTEECFDLKPDYLAADTAYGSAETLNWVVNEKRIAPHIPVVDKSGREDGSLSRGDFTFDKARNVYICPQGKLLHTTGYVHDQDEFTLGAIAQNLRRLAKLVARPPPAAESCPARCILSYPFKLPMSASGRFCCKSRRFWSWGSRCGLLRRTLIIRSPTGRWWAFDRLHSPPTMSGKALGNSRSTDRIHLEMHPASDAEYSPAAGVVIAQRRQILSKAAQSSDRRALALRVPKKGREPQQWL